MGYFLGLLTVVADSLIVAYVMSSNMIHFASGRSFTELHYHNQEEHKGKWSTAFVSHVHRTSNDHSTGRLRAVKINFTEAGLSLGSQDTSGSAASKIDVEQELKTVIAVLLA
jgi:hypothetical protein